MSALRKSAKVEALKKKLKDLRAEVRRANAEAKIITAKPKTLAERRRAAKISK